MAEIETTERLPKAQRTLATILDYLGLDATVKADELNGEIVLFTASTDAGRIIGKKGQTLHSLELIVNRMLSKNDIDCPRVTINVDGYTRRGGSSKSREDGRHHERRRPTTTRVDDEETPPSRKSRKSTDDNDECLKQQALDAAKEVKRWGESITLPPMNSHDRRTVHMALKDDMEIKTESVSSGSDTDDRLKSIIISLKGN